MASISEEPANKLSPINIIENQSLKRIMATKQKMEELLSVSFNEFVEGVKTMKISPEFLPDELPDQLPNEIKAHGHSFDLSNEMRAGEYIVFIHDFGSWSTMSEDWGTQVIVTNFGTLFECKTNKSYNNFSFKLISEKQRFHLISKLDIELLMFFADSSSKKDFDLYDDFIQDHIIKKSDNTLFSKWQNKNTDLEEKEKQLFQQEEQLKKKENEFNEKIAVQHFILEQKRAELNKFEEELNDRDCDLDMRTCNLTKNESKLKVFREKIKKTAEGIDMRATIQSHQDHLLKIATKINESADLMDYDGTASKEYALDAMELAKCHPNDFVETIENLGPFAEAEVQLVEACSD